MPRELRQPPNLQNTKIYCSFLAEFRSSDRKQDFWIHVKRSVSSVINNYREVPTFESRLPPNSLMYAIEFVSKTCGEFGVIKPRKPGLDVK